VSSQGREHGFDETYGGLLLSRSVFPFKIFASVSDDNLTGHYHTLN
jgi:hypothetical protein